MDSLNTMSKLDAFCLDKDEFLFTSSLSLIFILHGQIQVTFSLLGVLGTKEYNKKYRSNSDKILEKNPTKHMKISSTAQ